MSNAKTTRLTIELAGDLANAVAKAAGANKITIEEAIGECVSQSFETALRHRVLIQRQNDVDEALLELARFVERVAPAQASREKISASCAPRTPSDGDPSCPRFDVDVVLPLHALDELLDQIFHLLRAHVLDLLAHLLVEHVAVEQRFGDGLAQVFERLLRIFEIVEIHVLLLESALQQVA